MVGDPGPDLFVDTARQAFGQKSRVNHIRRGRRTLSRFFVVVAKKVHKFFAAGTYRWELEKWILGSATSVHRT
jgi:hypothetical protein